MIQINLKPGAKRTAARGSRPMFAGMAEAFKGLRSRVKEPWLAAAFAAWALVVLGLGGLFLIWHRRKRC